MKWIFDHTSRCCRLRLGRPTAWSAPNLGVMWLRAMIENLKAIVGMALVFVGIAGLLLGDVLPGGYILASAGVMMLGVVVLTAKKEWFGYSNPSIDQDAEL